VAFPVSVGVPVYRGELYLEETLRSIQRQTHRELDVLISIDGPDPACEAICERFRDDSRFRLVVQPERLGWVGNLNWLRSRATGDFWYFHQQDDLIDETYVEALLAHARGHPSAALVYCDVVAFGQIERAFDPTPEVTGATAFIRELTLLHEHFSAFAFRGLVRTGALRLAGDIPTNQVENLGVDLASLAGIALAGELLRLPLPLYRKRYHATNTESKWWSWDRATLLRAFSHHCADVLEQALRVEGSAEEMRLLFLAGVERLASPRTAGLLLPVAELTRAEREAMLETLLELLSRSAVHDLPVLLDSDWEDIRRLARAFQWIPGGAPVDIVRVGPNPVRRGRSFNPQPGGGSGLWVVTSRRAAPDSRLRLGGNLLDTTIRGTVLTACVPDALLERSAELELLVAGPDGTPRSAPMPFRVVDGDDD
jgi:hypothetical protein